MVYAVTSHSSPSYSTAKMDTARALAILLYITSLQVCAIMQYTKYTKKNAVASSWKNAGIIQCAAVCALQSDCYGYVVGPDSCSRFVANEFHAMCSGALPCYALGIPLLISTDATTTAQEDTTTIEPEVTTLPMVGTWAPEHMFCSLHCAMLIIMCLITVLVYLCTVHIPSCNSDINACTQDSTNSTIMYHSMNTQVI